MAVEATEQIDAAPLEMFIFAWATRLISASTRCGVRLRVDARACKARGLGRRRAWEKAVKIAISE